MPLFFSCKKEVRQPEERKYVSGILHYSDPAVDGAGLYYETVKGELLIFKNEFADGYTRYLHYQDMVEVPSRLVYTNTGDSSCLGGIAGPCTNQIPVVTVVSLIKQ
jgi:hypothetical protein